MEVHQGFSFEHGFISMKNFTQWKRPEEPEILKYWYLFYPVQTQLLRRKNHRMLKNEQIEIQIMISSPLLCGSTRLIVSVLKYNQVAENSYDQQSNFVRGTIYINEMISISEQKLICKWREGWTACKAPRDEIWIFHSQDLWESTIHFKTNIWFGQTRRVSVNQLWNRYW